MTRLEREVRKIANTYYQKEIYINAVNCTEKEIDFLRSAIQKDYLRVTPDIAKKVKRDAISDYISGKYIFPQQTYIVMGDETDCDFDIVLRD